MTRTLLQQALDALHPQANRAFVEATKDALRYALAAPQPEPVPEPFLCIAPACGNDCSDCNKAISAQTMRDYAIGYAMLRNAPIEAIRAGGVFAGRTPDNVVINGADLDAATFGAAAQQSIDQQVESINAVFDAWRNGEDASMTLALATPPAAPIDGFGGNLDEAFERAPAVPDAAILLLKELRHALEPISAYGRVGTRDDEQAKLQHLVAMIDRVLSAAPAVREPQEHVGWCRYVTAHEKATRLVLCDSDAPGAFRVYRRHPHHD